MRQLLVLAECPVPADVPAWDPGVDDGAPRTEDWSGDADAFYEDIDVQRRTAGQDEQQVAGHSDVDMGDMGAGRGPAEQADDGVEDDDPWEEEVPVLNATTRAFGTEQKVLRGRKVKIKHVVGRWCRVVQLARTAIS